MECHNDLTDDEDFMELVEALQAPRQYQERNNNYEMWDEKQFYDRFRLSKAVVNLITEEVTPEIRNNTQRNENKKELH
ncbi:hypothetical protein FQR65_LT15651 [Abscondita terminalis]|nr:hypothetical protein FQR65_LT15651 [Abscondita terminalis]